ncbi:MAG: hypothetical protein ACLQDQ_11485 [Myxococcaceae bacterium]
MRYEPGAETMAKQVAEALPSAIRTVEQRQFRPFQPAPTVFVCASVASYAAYGGNATSGGEVILGRLFLSPKPQNDAQRIPRLLTHELSHLHLGQHRSALRRLPMWFEEGLATDVSGGGGAEQVSAEQARLALLSGKALVPEARGGLFYRSTPSSSGISAHLFYREGAMFLEHLERKDSARFRTLLLGVEEGGALEEAFRRAYGEELSEAWSGFLAELKASVP